MKKEFITTRGKVFIEDDIMHIKQLIDRQIPSYGLFVVFMLLYTTSKITDDSKAKPMLIILFLLFGMMLLMTLYEILIMSAWKRKIGLREIKSFTIHKDVHELETEVVLYLKSGRQKKISFRNLEHQVEPFLEFVSQYLTQAQIAH